MTTHKICIVKTYSLSYNSGNDDYYDWEHVRRRIDASEFKEMDDNEYRWLQNNLRWLNQNNQEKDTYYEIVELLDKPTLELKIDEIKDYITREQKRLELEEMARQKEKARKLAEKAEKKELRQKHWLKS